MGAAGQFVGFPEGRLGVHSGFAFGTKCRRLSKVTLGAMQFLQKDLVCRGYKPGHYGEGRKLHSEMGVGVHPLLTDLPFICIPPHISFPPPPGPRYPSKKPFRLYLVKDDTFIFCWGYGGMGKHLTRQGRKAFGLDLIFMHIVKYCLSF